MINQSLIQFINDTKNQKELSLILAKTDDELNKFQSVLTKKDYIGSDDIFSVLSDFDTHNKIYLIINENNAKNLYDFAIQYPTGQINLFNSKTMENLSFTPNYEKHSVILLTTAKYMQQIEKNNLNFLNNVGTVYRS